MRKRQLPFRRRAMRLWLGVWVALCLLMTQWAAAAYVCPSDQARAPCHAHVDKHQPGLCNQHCNPVSLSDIGEKLPTVPPAVIPPLPPNEIVHSFHGMIARLAFDVREVLAASPPPIVRYCRYLI